MTCVRFFNANRQCSMKSDPRQIVNSICLASNRELHAPPVSFTCLWFHSDGWSTTMQSLQRMWANSHIGHTSMSIECLRWASMYNQRPSDVLPVFEMCLSYIEDIWLVSHAYHSPSTTVRYISHMFQVPQSYFEHTSWPSHFTYIKDFRCSSDRY